VSTYPLLVVEHEAQCPPGWMGEWLLEAGERLDVRRPYVAEPLPADLSQHSGMVVLGGEMGAYDDRDHPWLAEVRGLVLAAVQDRTPVLGICLGHQLAAVALGGEVRPNAAGQQIGVLEVGWADAAAEDPLVGPLVARGGPAPAVQWNNDVVSRLPDGAVDLAHTGRGELQAARFAERVWGVQWHPEAGEEIIRPWAEVDRDDALERGVDLDEYVDQVVAAREELRAAWRVLAVTFASLCCDAAGQEPALRDPARVEPAPR
jgi:GMP synthase (glutamine-hydrolysing)